MKKTGMKDTASYTAASAFPVKLAQLGPLTFLNNDFVPIHVQLCPTNRCNLNCPFCSCSEREKGEELSFHQIESLFTDLYMLEGKAITITGGGEPLLHPQIGGIIESAARNFDVGLVTNGLELQRLSLEQARLLTWCRISVSDFRDIDLLLRRIDPMMEAPIDWAFSYVITSETDLDKIRRVIRYANALDFTHVRLVSDLMDLKNIPSMAEIKSELEGIDDSRVIYQGRKAYVPGHPECRHSLLRPVIAPDGWIYPCCGVQYAMKDSTGTFPEEMRMCRMEDMSHHWIQKKQPVFCGKVCDRCYYDEYNLLLEILSQEVKHGEFV